MKRTCAWIGIGMALVGNALLAAAAPCEPTVTSIHCETPGGVLRPGETPVLFLTNASAAQLSWKLEDAYGRERARGAWPATGRLSLAPLETGYYRLTAAHENGKRLRSTTLCVVEPIREPLPEDSRWAIMTALPCVVRPGNVDAPWHGGDLLRRDADLLAELGFRCAREIFLWPEMEPQRGVERPFEARAQRAFDLLAARGVKMMPFFERAPAWTKLGDESSELPRDLMALYRFAARLARENRGRAACWEFWNEPDIACRSREGAWEYAACQKAAYLGFKDGDGATPATHGAFCHAPFTDYNRAVCANDIAKYTDVFNYHCYQALSAYPAWAADLRRLMAEAGCADRALWITEHSTNQEGNSTEDSVRKGFKQHSREQEAIVAEFIPKGFVGLAMEGVARDFLFILTGINERQGTKDWGLTRRDGTVKPAFAAAATFLRRVGAARFEGALETPADIRAYLFSHTNGQQTVMAWAVSDLDRAPKEIKGPLRPHARTWTAPGKGPLRVTDHLGFSSMCAGGALTLTRTPVYIDGLRGLSPKKAPRPVGKVGATPPAPDEDRRVVVQLRPDRSDFALGDGRATAEMKNANGKIRVEVWNFEGRAKRGRLVVGGGRLAGLPDEVALPAWGHATFQTTLQTTGVVGRIEVAGVFNGRRASRLVMPYHDVATLAAHAAVVPLATDDPARWTRNTSAHTWTCSYDRVEKAIRFDAAWKPDASDRWMYPKYTLDPSRENMAGAVEVTYEVKMEQDKAENDVDHCNAMLAYAPGKGRTMLFLPQKPPGGTWERRSFVVPAHSPDGGPASVDVQGIQFGCGPRGTRLTYWLRNVRVLRSPRALVDYAPYFTDEVYAQTNGCRRANLEPMLDAETLVPNGGICRFMPNGGWKKDNTPRLARVFGESPYQTSAPMLYDRPDWYELERARGEWLFDRRLEPLFKRCLAERARLTLGLACNTGSGSVRQMHAGRALAVPAYLFDEVAAEGHPFLPDDQFGPSWFPDYTSPRLLERHRALLNAFAAWLEGNVEGTRVRRKDVLFSVEMRYAGYWGEGAMPGRFYPATNALDGFLQAYLDALPDTLLIAGGHETLHLPHAAAFARNPADPKFLSAMRHVRALFSARNRAGGLGFFIDSWHPYSDQYDLCSTRLLFDAEGRPQNLGAAFRDEIYGSRYLTGEFGFLFHLSVPDMGPYEGLYQQFSTRHMSGISVHNFTAKHVGRKPKVERGAHFLPGAVALPESVYANGRKCMSMLGYRFVLESPQVVRRPEGGRRVSFSLANIGTSRCFCDWWRIHLVARGADGAVREDVTVPFDVRTLKPATTPLLLRSAERAPVEADLASEDGDVFLVIKDAKGIEQPLCLSNYGRLPDGSYRLGAPSAAAPDPVAVFRAPPPKAHAGVWWHWMGRHVTREGIRKDLDWFARMGVTTATIFGMADTCSPSAQEMPDGREPHVVAFTPDWWAFVRYAAEEAGKRGIELGLHNCPGYTHTGGPWTTPAHAMRDLVVAIDGTDEGRIVDNYRQGTFRPVAGGKNRPIDRQPIARVTTGGRTYVLSHALKPQRNSPCQPQAAGWECDKMSPDAVHAHWDAVLSQLRKHLGPVLGTTVTFLHADSNESGTPSWTPRMREEFRARRGYDPLPFLPSLAGFPVDDPARAGTFKEDFDLTVRELYRDACYRISHRRLHAMGLEFSSEPYGGPVDRRLCGASVDRLMTEFWSDPGCWRRAELRGKYAPADNLWDLTPAPNGGTHTVVEAEAFTGHPRDSRWSETPWTLKRPGDCQFVNGVNRMVLHSVPLQCWPDTVVPGMTFGCWGTHFSRHQTWAECGRAWFDYLARAQALLQWGTTLRGERLPLPDAIWQRARVGVVGGRRTVVRFLVNGAEGETRVSLAGVWLDPVTGLVSAPPRTLASRQSGFLLEGTTPSVPYPLAGKRVGTLANAWRVSFPAYASQPPETAFTATFQALADWTDHPDDRIRHYSGTATYRTTFDARGGATALDLGACNGQLARVRLNGRDLGVAWCAPWRVAIPADALKAKGNDLEIEFTNVWANRLVGDEREPREGEWREYIFKGTSVSGRREPERWGWALERLPGWLAEGRPRPATGRVAFVPWNYFTKDDRLVPSGLLGPVCLLRNEPVEE